MKTRSGGSSSPERCQGLGACPQTSLPRPIVLLLMGRILNGLRYAIPPQFLRFGYTRSCRMSTISTRGTCCSPGSHSGGVCFPGPYLVCGISWCILGSWTERPSEAWMSASALAPLHELPCCVDGGGVHKGSLMSTARYRVLKVLSSW